MKIKTLIVSIECWFSAYLGDISVKRMSPFLLATKFDFKYKLDENTAGISYKTEWRRSCLLLIRSYLCGRKY